MHFLLIKFIYHINNLFLMINILDIPDQYFLVWDGERHEAIKDSLDLVATLRTEDTEERREFFKTTIKISFCLQPRCRRLSTKNTYLKENA